MRPPKFWKIHNGRKWWIDQFVRQPSWQTLMKFSLWKQKNAIPDIKESDFLYTGSTRPQTESRWLMRIADIVNWLCGRMGSFPTTKKFKACVIMWFKPDFRWPILEWMWTVNDVRDSHHPPPLPPPSPPLWKIINNDLQLPPFTELSIQKMKRWAWRNEKVNKKR